MITTQCGAKKNMFSEKSLNVNHRAQSRKFCPMEYRLESTGALNYGSAKNDVSLLNWIELSLAYFG